MLVFNTATSAWNPILESSMYLQTSEEQDMDMSSEKDRQVPSISSLIARRRIGNALLFIGIAVIFYSVGSHFHNWAQGPYWHSPGNEPVFTHPILEWYLSIPFILFGFALAAWSREEIDYWHRWVESGVIVDKDIVHYSEYNVSYVIYVEGKTRAGETRKYGHRMTHGQYEQKRIGDSISFSE